MNVKVLSPYTNTAQTFIRLVVFVVVFIILGILVLLPSSVLLTTGTGLGTGTFFFLLLLTFWIPSIISKMFYVLPEWERLVLLRLGKFVGVKGPGFFHHPSLYLFGRQYR